MKYEYNRIKIEFALVNELLEELNTLGELEWEIIHYEEKKPEKFGDKYQVLVIVKRIKPT